MSNKLNKSAINSFTKKKIRYAISYLWECLYNYPRVRIGYLLRSLDFVQSRKYGELKRYAGIHEGKRCFIVCTGPSLRLSDLEKLRNEVCFSMNSIVMLFNETLWRPTYYATSGIDKFKAYIEEAAQNGELPTIFITPVDKQKYAVGQAALHSYPVINSAKIYHRKVYKSTNIKSIKDWVFKFSDNLYRGISGGGSTTCAFLQIAVYMGFKEIYLLGCDCDYLGAAKHHPSAMYAETTYETYTAPQQCMDKMVVAYMKAKEYADAHGIKIYNATRGGALEVFERVDLDKVLNNSQFTIHNS